MSASKVDNVLKELDKSIKNLFMQFKKDDDRPEQEKPPLKRKILPGCKYKRIESFGKHLGKIYDIDYYLVRDMYKIKHYVFRDNGTLEYMYQVTADLAENDLLKLCHARKNLKENRRIISKL